MGLTNNWFGSSYANDHRVVWDTADFQFLSVSLTSGMVLAEFPALQVSELSYRFGETTSETAILPWKNIPSKYDDATLPYAESKILDIKTTKK